MYSIVVGRARDRCPLFHKSGLGNATLRRLVQRVLCFEGRGSCLSGVSARVSQLVRISDARQTKKRRLHFFFFGKMLRQRGW